MRKKHNISLANHNTPNNREAKNHNLSLSNHNILFCTTLCLSGLTVLSGFVLSNLSYGSLFNSSASATSSDLKASQASVMVSAFCSINASITSEHHATLVGGQYSGDNGLYPDGIGSTTFSVLCNDLGGYDIYVAGFTNNAAGNNILTDPTINTGNNNYDIISGTATSGNVSNWSMKIAQVTGADQTPPTLTDYFLDGNGDGVGSPQYVTVPNQYTRLAYHPSRTNATIETANSSITTTYAAYISPNQPAGTYTGQVAYMVVHPTDGSIQEDYYSMQNIAQWKSSIKIGQEVTAFDMHDGKSYTVARLCMDAVTPSNCVNGATDANDTYSKIWMTQNLDLTIESNRTYTHTDTDLGWATTPYDVSANWTPGTGIHTATEITYPDVSDSGIVTGWGGSSNTNAYQAEGVDAQGNEIYVRQGVKYVGLQACLDAGHTEYDCNHYKVGNYYSWTAAIARTNSSNYSDDYTIADSSICPAGWRLPNGITDINDDDTADTPSDFNVLLKANGITSNLTDYTGTNVDVGYATNNGFTNIGLAPLYFVRSGGLGGSTLSYFRMNGRYWSSTVRSSTVAYSLDYNSSSLYPANLNSRYLGRSLRCIAR